MLRSLYLFLEKRVMLNILATAILASYGILLSQTFYKDIGEFKLVWLQNNILTGRKKVVLKLKSKDKYIVFPSNEAFP